MVLVTDGSLGIGKGSLRHSLQTQKHRGEDKKFPLPFPFPCKLFILCVANAEEVLVYSFTRNHYLNPQTAEGLSIYRLQPHTCVLP